MITIMKKDFPAFVEDFAGTYKAEPNNIVAVCFDDKKRQAYMIDNNNKKIMAFKPVFYAIWYNMGNNAIVCVKRHAMVFDFKLKVMKIVETSFIKKK